MAWIGTISASYKGCITHTHSKKKKKREKKEWQKEARNGRRKIEKTKTNTWEEEGTMLNALLEVRNAKKTMSVW